jgi:hypothetical protein
MQRGSSTAIGLQACVGPDEVGDKVSEVPTAARIDLGAPAGVAARVLLHKIACFRGLERPEMACGVPFQVADHMSVGPARQPRLSHERATGRAASEFPESPMAGSHLLDQTPDALNVAIVEGRGVRSSSLADVHPRQARIRPEGGLASYSDAQVAAAVTAMDKYRGGERGEVGAALMVVGLSAERAAREARLRDDMIRVAHRAGASLRQLAEVSGLDRKTVTAIVGATAHTEA